jgi:hypothetical protein
MNTTTNIEIESPVTMAIAEALLLEYIAERQPVLLSGPPGVGKTSVVKQVANKLGYSFMYFDANIRESVDFRGVPAADLKTNTTKWLTPDELPRVDRDGKNGILMLDDLPTAPANVQAVCFPLVLEGRVGDYRLPDGWIAIATGNQMKDRAATHRMPTALRNRFAHILVQVELDSFIAWSVANNVHPKVIAFVRFMAKRDLSYLHRMPRGDENAFPTPRSIVACGKFADKLPNIRQHLLTGLVGRDVGSEMHSFFSLCESITDLEEIAHNPKTATVPSEPSLRYAVATAAAAMANKQNFAAIATYAKRLPDEWQMVVMHDAVRRTPALANTKTYGEWLVNNQHLTMQAA